MGSVLLVVSVQFDCLSMLGKALSRSLIIENKSRKDVGPEVKGQGRQAIIQRVLEET
jgi:hypothetical protein